MTPDGEAQKRVYEQLAAINLDLATLEGEEELVELARTLAKGGPYAGTVERWARDHGYGQTGDQGPERGRDRQAVIHVNPPDPQDQPRMDWPSE